MAKNYKENFNDADGVWRTVGGRRIFIRNGQDLASAMVESGKFKNLKSTYKKQKEENKELPSKIKNELKERQFSERDIKYAEYLYNEQDIRGIEALTEEINSNYRYGSEEADKFYDKFFSKIETKEKETFTGPSKQKVDSLKEIYGLSQKEAEYAYENKLSAKEINEMKEKSDKYEKINPMEEYSDTNGKGMTDAQEKILNAVKTSFLYKDEGEMSSGLQKNYELYGKENVDSALKYYEDNYELIKGVASDSEGLTYNDLIKKDEYPENALKYYKNQMEELKNSGLQYKDSKAYNDKADALKEELEKSKSMPTYQDDVEGKRLPVPTYKEYEKRWEKYGDREEYADTSYEGFISSLVDSGEITDKQADMFLKEAEKEMGIGEPWPLPNDYDKAYSENISEREKEITSDLKWFKEHDDNYKNNPEYKALKEDLDWIKKNKETITRNGVKYNVTEHKDESYFKGQTATGRYTTMHDPERYKIENPNDKSDWGWIDKKEYDELKSNPDIKYKQQGSNQINDTTSEKQKQIRHLEKTLSNAYKNETPSYRASALESKRLANISKRIQELKEDVKKEKSTASDINDSLRRKAYQKYMKEHPNSKKTFNDFMK